MTKEEREFSAELRERLDRMQAALEADPPDETALRIEVEAGLQTALWRGYDRQEGWLDRLRAILTRVEVSSGDFTEAAAGLLAAWRGFLGEDSEEAASELENALERLEALPSVEVPELDTLLERGAELAAGLSGAQCAPEIVAELIEVLRDLDEHHAGDPRASVLVGEVYEEVENARRSGAPLGADALDRVTRAFARALGLEVAESQDDEEPSTEKLSTEPDREPSAEDESDDSLAERLFASFKPKAGGAAGEPDETEKADDVEEAEEPAFEKPAPTTADTGGLRSEMLDIFTSEAEELVDQLNSNLLLLENEPDNPELIRELMRLAHTLKGAAAMLGFTVMSRVARSMEDLLNVADEANLTLGGRAVDLLFNLTDQATLLLEDLGETGGDVVLEEERSRELEAQLSEMAEVVEELENRGVEAPVSPREALAAQAPTRGRGFRVDPTRLDHLLNLAGELVIARTRINDILGNLRGLYDVYAERVETLERLSGRLEVYGAGEAVPETAEALGLGGSHRTISDFSAHEFDRFSELDALTRDARGLASAFGELGDDYESATGLLAERLNELSLIAGNIQDEVTMVRMVPFGTVATRFRRAARDIARYYGKEIDFQTVGDETEIDKKLLDELMTPITHLIRNAVAHGVETQGERLAAGKGAAGTVRLEAYHLGNSVVVEVYDDGAGIDPQKIGDRAVELGLITREERRHFEEDQLRRLIFTPGFTTAAELTETAGRGYGLDIVEKRLKEMRGAVEIDSQPGSHTRFTLTLPLTLGISEGLFIGVAGQTYALPLVEVEETLSLDPELLTTLSGLEVYRHRELLLPVLRLGSLFGSGDGETGSFVVIVRSGERQLALIIETLLGKEEMVIKPTGGLLKNLPMFGGATTLGDGTVALIINPDDLAAPARAVPAARRASRRVEEVPTEAAVETVEPATEPTAPPTLREERLDLVPDTAGEGFGISVLLVDDSVSIRNFVGRMLSRRGFEVRTAADGIEALQLLDEREFDCVLTDLEMPRMHGYELISEIKSSSKTRHLPVMILTARTGEKHRQRARELGVEVFLTKPFNERALVEQLIELSRG